MFNIIRCSFVLIFGLGLVQCNQVSKPDSPPITVPSGFEIELIYSPSEHDQGSWVSLTTDDKGRLIASDQYGDLYRISLPSGDDDLTVEQIPLKIGGAQGLLWAFSSLYVSVNTFSSENGLASGIYRLTDTDQDDQLDHIEALVQLEGAGEHGPHSLILGPDGEQVYFIAGNHTDVPAEFDSFVPAVWKEDRLRPAIKDPRGHANDRGAPGGWIARSNDQGTSWEIIANGFRNAYDIAFNGDGELFTYDSDMEWDLGTPWYRPTRICHVIPGSEFGWRTGSGKWPDYYLDNLPGVLPMGQGSPTGITFGTGTHFPEKYQQGLFALDWSFGTIYFVEFTPQGASYSGRSEEFLSGNSLPVTDVVVGPNGALYFTTGGRKSSSGLYKVSYPQGLVSNQASATRSAGTSGKEVQAINSDDAQAVDSIWANLGNKDRYVRYAARVALERQSLSNWEHKIQQDASTDITLQSSVALIRVGDDHYKQPLLARLSTLTPSDLDNRQKLDLLRVYGLLFSRWGPPEPGLSISLPDYPSGDAALDRELCDLLVYLGDSEVVSKTLPLIEKSQTTLESTLTGNETLLRSEQYGPVIAAMHENRPFEQSMAYAVSLSAAQVGWTPALRARYFKWFYQSLVKSGGESYRGFLEKIRQNALASVPSSERNELAVLSGESLLQEMNLLADDVDPPKGPGRVWEVGFANKLISDDAETRSFEHGKQMYQALRCGTCHIMQGKGGTIGPNLTQISTRSGNWDLLQSLMTPSLAISDQYAATLYTLEDSTTLIGRTLSSDEDSVYINVNPYQPAATKAISKSRIVNEQLSPVSLMPGGLLNQLNEQELLDLMAYLNSGGSPEHEVYEDD